MEIKNRYVIGTHVMWYEIEMYANFVDGLVNLLEPVTNKENVIIDLCFNASQKFEQIVDTEDIYKLKEKFLKGVSKIKDLGFKVVVQVKGMPHQENEFYFHADYRRDLNYNYCKKVDFVMWGETDSFFPREAFQAIDSLKEYTDGIGEHKYIACFSDRKMWDSSWDATVHKDYVDIKFVDDDFFLNHFVKNFNYYITNVNKISLMTYDYVNSDSYIDFDNINTENDDFIDY